jgi:hypothetical protein
MITVTVFVAELVLVAREVHRVEGLVGGHPEVIHLANGDAANGHLHERSHTWRCFELEFRHDTDVVVVADSVSFAKVDDRCGGHRGGFFGEMTRECKRGERP